MKLTITINGGNEAMQTSEDFADVLEKAAAFIRRHDMKAIERYEYKYLLDCNGNVVGRLTVNGDS